MNALKGIRNKELIELFDNYEKIIGFRDEGVITPDSHKLYSHAELMSILLNEEKRMKCIVNNCNNYTDQGEFVGELCSPCYRALTTGDTTNTAVYWLAPIREKVSEYSFNAEIIAALEQGKSVWSSFEDNKWFEIKQPGTWGLTATHSHKWSLTKPKEKVKKYNWTYKTKREEYHISAGKFATKEDANKAFRDMRCIVEILEPYLPSMIEVEE